jgi:hypothetical protein
MVLNIIYEDETNSTKTLNLLPYLAFGGLQWQRSDIDGSNAGRSLDNAYLYRDRVATKYRLDCTLRPLTTQEAQLVLKAIKPEFVKVTYTDPELGLRENVEMYSNNVPASFMMVQPNSNIEYWSGITFPLIER